MSDTTVVHGQNCICHLCQPSEVSVVRQVAAAGPRRIDGTLSWQTAQRVPNTAFVLSGGASLGALQVGMLRAVYSSDVELILLPAPNPTQVQPIDFDHSSRLIREALTATRAFLARRGTAFAQRAVERAPGTDPPVATRLAA